MNSLFNVLLWFAGITLGALLGKKLFSPDTRKPGLKLLGVATVAGGYIYLMATGLASPAAILGTTAETPVMTAVMLAFVATFIVGIARIVFVRTKL